MSVVCCLAVLLGNSRLLPVRWLQSYSIGILFEAQNIFSMNTIYAYHTECWMKSREMLFSIRLRLFRFSISATDCICAVFEGKTSLIKALTGEKSMQPRDQLFATLDVTVHAGFLPNRLKVLFVDTVGFISDIPTTLVESFAATLEDIASAVRHRSTYTNMLRDATWRISQILLSFSSSRHRIVLWWRRHHRMSNLGRP